MKTSPAQSMGLRGGAVVMQGGEKCQAWDGGRTSSGSCESVLRQELSVCFCLRLYSDMELSKDAPGQVLSVKTSYGCSMMSCAMGLCDLISPVSYFHGQTCCLAPNTARVLYCFTAQLAFSCVGHR